MKNSFRFFGQAALACLLSALVLHSEPAKIGLVLKEQGSFWGELEKGAKSASAAGNLVLVSKAPPAEADISIQAQLVISLVKQNVQAIIAAPSSREAMRPALEAAAAKGIKIVIIDSPLEGVTGSVFVGTDQTAAGLAAGRLLLPLLKDKEELGILRHTQGNPATTQREVGAVGVLKASYPGLSVLGDIYAGSEKGLEFEKAKLFLAKYPRIKAILSSGTIGTMALLKVLNDNGNAGKVPLVGFGYNCNAQVAAALESGALTGWIAQEPYEVGKTAVETAAKMIKGEQVPAVQSIPILVVTKETLKDAKVQEYLK